MRSISKKEPFFLFIGDILSLVLALWFALVLRFGNLPSSELFFQHLLPFSFLFLLSVLVFFISGLYERRHFISIRKIGALLLNAELVNMLLAIVFFYLVNLPGITPKTILFLYFVSSLFITFLWRYFGRDIFLSRRRDRAILLGGGEDVEALYEQVSRNPRHMLDFVSRPDLSKIDFASLKKEIEAKDITFVAVDFEHEKIVPIVKDIYGFLFSKIHFVDVRNLYEGIFDRIPLSLIESSWFLENVSVRSTALYDFLKRLMDIVISIPLLLIPIISYPFLALAIKLEDGGPVFFSGERIGKNGNTFKILKYRTMTSVSVGDPEASQRITRFGAYLRKTRLDEFPQLWNVLRGELSLIGPRPELPALVSHYEKEIPFYRIRHLITPGLSGWAQIYHENHPHHAVAVEETKEKLSYDLYYIKYRSFFLDLKIALRTLQILLSQKGR